MNNDSLSYVFKRPLGPYQMHQHLNYRSPEEEEKKKGHEKIFEEIIDKSFPNMEKEIANEVQEAQRIPYRINPRRNTPRHILIKLTKTEHKERILKAVREKQQLTYKRNSKQLIFQQKLCRAEGNGKIYLKY